MSSMARRVQDPETEALNRKIGPRYRLFRKLNTTMSGKDFAKALGITPGAVSMIERGERGMKKALQPKAAQLLRCSLLVLTDPRDLPEEDLIFLNNAMLILDNKDKVDTFPMLKSHMESVASKIKSRL
jgi:hypothetical protein